jgi:hypothetical protein
MFPTARLKIFSVRVNMLISPPYPEKISSFLTSDYVSKDIGAHNTHL